MTLPDFIIGIRLRGSLGIKGLVLEDRATCAH